MRFFWKLLLVAIPFGSYWLYKKSSRSSGNTQEQSEQAEASKTASQSPAKKGAAAKQGGVDSTEQIIEQLTEIDGVTSRVARNLVKHGIKNKKALLELSEEELKSIKGIGPKRAAKILNLR